MLEKTSFQSLVWLYEVDAPEECTFDEKLSCWALSMTFRTQSIFLFGPRVDFGSRGVPREYNQGI